MSKNDQALLIVLTVAGLIALGVGYSLGWTDRDKAAYEWYELTVIPGLDAEADAHAAALTLEFERTLTDAEDAWGLAMGSSTRSAYQDGYSEGYWDGLSASLKFNVTTTFPWITDPPPSDVNQTGGP